MFEAKDTASEFLPVSVAVQYRFDCYLVMNSEDRFSWDMTQLIYVHVSKKN